MKLSFVQRCKAAYNAYAGRFQSLDKDGFPVFTYATNSGMAISAERALYATAVFACVNLLASVIASIPIRLYRQDTEGDMEESKTNPLYWLLSYRPNKWQTAYDYWLYNVECILLRGGFISWKNTLGSGKIASLVPLNPDTVTREFSPSGDILISGMAQWGPTNFLKFDRTPISQFFWANYRTLDGLNPCSPIKYAAESIGLALTAEEHGAHVFANDATPPLVIQHPEKLSPENLKNLAAMWKAGGSGANYGMPRFLDGGAKIEKMSMSNEDCQYFETRRFQREDICGIFRVPPSMIGDTQRAQGWSTLEQKNSDFLTYTLTPYLVNIEQACERSLIPEKDWGDLLARYNTKSLLKADIVNRTAHYNTMYNLGALSPNEIRHAEGLNSRDGGNEYVRSAAMVIDSDLDNTAPIPTEKPEEEDNAIEK